MCICQMHCWICNEDVTLVTLVSARVNNRTNYSKKIYQTISVLYTVTPSNLEDYIPEISWSDI